MGYNPRMIPRLFAVAGIRRAPCALPAWVFVCIALHYGLTSAYNLLTGSLGGAWTVTPPMALRWGLSTFLVSLFLLACLPLLAALRAWGWDWTRPRVSSWLLYFGVFAAAAFAGSVLRSWLAPWSLGSALPEGTFWRMVTLLSMSHLCTIAPCEIFLARRRARVAWIAESEHLELELTRSRSRLVEADDHLRREVAEHLHGEVQSRLLMAWALLDQARGGDAAQEAALLMQTQEQLDRLQKMGLPQARELLGAQEAARPFSEAVTELVARFAPVMPVELSMDARLSACQDRLAPALRRSARRLLEEALLNAFRHARAEHVRVSLAPRSEAALVLSVEDDGVGFDPAAAPKGLGLSGLGADLGGALEVVSAPGAGTRIVLHLPLSAALPGGVA